MKICLIGQNLTNLILAYLFSEKKLNVDIYLNKKIQKVKTNRTIALSSENFDYLKSLTRTVKMENHHCAYLRPLRCAHAILEQNHCAYLKSWWP